MSPNLLSGAARLAGSSLLRLQSDDRLIALIRDGHDPAFSAVVERYRAELLRYATRLVGESRAEDIVQQAFLNAHTAMTSSQADIRLRPWLYRIAHNAAVNVLRSSHQEDELDERFAAADAGLEDQVETRERLQEALVAISRLPEPQRDALTLRALEGRSHTEIADSLGVSPGAARQHLHRARTTVRAAVSAITPYGLMVRLAMGEMGDPATASLTGAGVGMGATVIKVGAGVLAAGALATGATHLPFVNHHHHHASARSAVAAAESPPASAAATGAPTPVDIVSTASTAGQRREDRRLAVPGVSERHGGRGGSSGRGSGSGSGDGSSGSGDSHSGSSGSGSSGSGDSHSGSSGSGDSHSGSSNSGSGKSGSGSGSSGSSGDGSDGSSGTSGSGDGTTTSTGSSDGGSGSGDAQDGSGSDGGSTTTTTTPISAPTTEHSGSGKSSGGSGSSGSGSSDGGGSDDTTTVPGE